MEIYHEPPQIKGLQRYLSQLPAVLGVLLLIGAIYVVQKEFRHLRLRDIVAVDPIKLVARHIRVLQALCVGLPRKGSRRGRCATRAL